MSLKKTYNKGRYTITLRLGRMTMTTTDKDELECHKKMRRKIDNILEQFKKSQNTYALEKHRGFIDRHIKFLGLKEKHDKQS